MDKETAGGLTMVIGLAAGALAAFGMASIVGKDGSAQTQAQSLTAIITGALFWLLSFIGAWKILT
jgi:hypothetical protein